MEHQADTVIGTDVLVKGNLHNKGSILVNGNVEGEIKSEEGVTVGETATVTGPIVAKNVLISGKVAGTIETSDKLEIDPTGVVNGDLKIKTLIVREGAVFNGNCVMEKTSKESQVTNVATNLVPVPEPDEKKEDKKDPLKAAFWDKNKK